MPPLLLLSLVPSLLVPSTHVSRTHAAHRAPQPHSPSLALVHADGVADGRSGAGVAAEWALIEDWALVDDAAAFTVAPTCSDAPRVTFWRQLGASNPHLCRRSPDELRARLSTLTQRPVWREPRVLHSAARLPDGRWSGAIDGSLVTLSVAAEGRLAAADAREEPSYVEAAGGQIFSLEHAGEGRWGPWGAAAARLPDAAAARRGAADLLVPALVASALLVGAQLVALGAASAAPLAERVSRQELRVSVAQAEILALEQRLSDDQESLRGAFATRMGELEPRLRASEQRLAELRSCS